MENGSRIVLFNLAYITFSYMQLIVRIIIFNTWCHFCQSVW